MPARPAVCPPDDSLVAFGLGKLAADASDEVSRHLETCLPCRRRVGGLSDDSFLGRLRSAAGNDTVDAPPKTDPDPKRTPKPAVGVPPELTASGQYANVRELGRGGMGVVYLARNVLMDRDEVLKVVGRDLLAKSGAAERFLREIRAAAKLQHPNVVAAYAAHQFGDLLVFAMEHVPGADLNDVVRAKGPLPIAVACGYAYHAALGLQHAHERGMVHRDIKPSNLILTKSGGKPAVKILDFGLAKATREKEAAGGLTTAGQVLGTPDYMAPEQARDTAVADTRADVYSLGCTLFFLLAGRPPFVAATLYDLLHKHQTQAPPPLDQLRPDAPPELSAVVARMMAKEPGQRFPTPGEAAKALAPFVKAAGSKPVIALLDAEVVEATQAAPKPAWEPPSVFRNMAVPQHTRHLNPEDFAPPPKPGRKPPAKRKTKRHPTRPWAIPAAVFGTIAVALLGAWAAGAFKVSVKTKAGTLVVESDEPGEVLVDGEVMRVTWTANGKTSTAEVSVRPGTHKIEVRKDGFTFSGDKEIAVADGQRQAFRAHLYRNNDVAPRPAAGDEKPPRRPLAKAAVPAAFEEITGATPADLRAWAGGLPPGYRPVWVSARAGTDEVRFDAAAVPDPLGAEWRLLVRESTAEVDADRQALPATGYATEVYASFPGGDARIWGKRPAGEVGYWFGPADYVAGKLAEAKAGGWPRSIGRTRRAGTDMHTVSYEDRVGWLGPPDFEWHADLSAADLDAQVEAYRRRGWRVRVVSPHVGVPDPRYYAVFARNEPAVGWDYTPRLTRDEYQAAVAEHKAAGRVPECVTSAVVGGDVWYTAVWVEDQLRTTAKGSHPPPAEARRLHAATNRYNAAAHGATFRADGDELVVAGGAVKHAAWLHFGDTAWTDYDFTAEVLFPDKVTGAALYARVNYEYDGRRRPDLLPSVDRRCAIFPFAFGGNSGVAIESWRDDGGYTRDGLPRGTIPNLLKPGTWFKATVKVRGDTIETYLNDQPIHRGKPPMPARGGVGVQALEAGPVRFRHLKVTAPDGKVLWSGLPELPGEPVRRSAVPAAFTVATGATPGELRAWVAGLPDGYKPAWVSARAGTPDTRFDAVAVHDPNASPWKLLVRESAAEADADIDARHAEGFSPEFIAPSPTGFVYLWGKHHIPNHWRGSAADIADKLRAAQADGCWPLSVGAARRADGSAVHAAVYEYDSRWLGAPAFEWHADLSAAELDAQVEAYRRRGWRPRLVSPHAGRADLRYYAVFERNDPPVEWAYTPGQLVGEYEATEAERRAGGFRPQCVTSAVVGGEVRFTSVWVDDPFRLVARGEPVPAAECRRQIDTGNRFATLLGAKFRAADGELEIDTTADGSFGHLFFGDPDWTDYDFEAEVKLSDATAGAGLFFRVRQEYDGWRRPDGLPCVSRVCGVYAAGFAGNTAIAVEGWRDWVGYIPTEQKSVRPAVLQAAVWHTLKASVRGDTVETFLDGRPVHTSKPPMPAKGGVGLRLVEGGRTARFRNVKVTAADGTVLWDKLPEVPK